jgi:hypothetical protein
MAYVYFVGFEVGRGQMGQLEIGAALERVLSYLRTLLPSEQGFTTVRAIRSVGTGNRVTIHVESEWDTWSDIVRHKESSLAEDKVLREFQPHVDIGDLVVQVYEEIS